MSCLVAYANDMHGSGTVSYCMSSSTASIERSIHSISRMAEVPFFQGKRLVGKDGSARTLKDSGAVIGLYFGSEW